MKRNFKKKTGVNLACLSIILYVFFLKSKDAYLIQSVHARIGSFISAKHKHSSMNKFLNITHNRLTILLEIQSCTQAVINTHIHFIHLMYPYSYDLSSGGRKEKEEKRYDYVHRFNLATMT